MLHFIVELAASPDLFRIVSPFLPDRVSGRSMPLYSTRTARRDTGIANDSSSSPRAAGALDQLDSLLRDELKKLPDAGVGVKGCVYLVAVRELHLDLVLSELQRAIAHPEFVEEVDCLGY